jgi:predicted Zn-dependent protease
MEGTRLSFLFCLGVLLGWGCSAKKTDDTSLSLTNEEQKILDDYKAELSIGRNMAGRLFAFYGEYNDLGLKSYVNQVGQYVAKYGDYPDRRYLFGILDSDTVNAFACPGGYILLTRGLVASAENEAELAAILGHEAAHVGKQHMYKTLQTMNKEQMDKADAAFKSRKRLDKHSRARSRIQNDSQENDSISAVAKLMMTASGAGIGVLQAAKVGMGLLLEKGLDKSLEFEADREGVKYAIRAGYDPKAMDQFLMRLAEAKKKAKDKSVMDVTHPTIPDRRQEIADVLNKMNASEIIGAIGKERFESARVGLMSKKKG